MKVKVPALESTTAPVSRRVSRFLTTACALFLMASGNAMAQYAIAPVTGAAIVTHGKFTNIYLYPDPSAETWDQHLASISASGNAVDPADTSEAIDAFTLAISQSHYFDSLMQYRTTCFLCTGDGIHPPLFLGSEKTIKKCVDAAVGDAKNKVFSYGTLRSFAACEQGAGGNPSDQVNLIVSPEFDVAGGLGPAVGAHPSNGDCASSVDSGFHGWGLSVPNFTVIPTNARCNKMFSDLTRTMTHEMVETLSDPGGLGYIHESGTVLRVIGDDNDEFNEGELGDICEGGGPQNPNNISAIAYLAMLNTSVSKYWSNSDYACVPIVGSDPFNDRVWIDNEDNPLIEFRGDVHTYTASTTVSSSDVGRQINLLTVFLGTGSDDLRGGSDPNANADVFLQLASGAALSFLNVNKGMSWENDETHAIPLYLPATVRAGDITGLTLHTQFGGGIGGDNWKVNQVQLTANLGPVLPPPGPTTLAIRSWIDSSGTPLVRFTGSNHDWKGATSVLASDIGEAINQLSLTVVTGSDDLGGGSDPSSNADVILNLSPGGQSRAGTAAIAITNINAGQHWQNGETHVVTLPVPGSLQAGDIVSLDLQTQFGGGLFGDNWNVNRVLLQAALLVPVPPACPSNGKCCGGLDSNGACLAACVPVGESCPAPCLNGGKCCGGVNSFGVCAGQCIDVRGACAGGCPSTEKCCGQLSSSGACLGQCVRSNASCPAPCPAGQECCGGSVNAAGRCAGACIRPGMNCPAPR